MLEKPDLSDEKLVACLRAGYDVVVRQIDFLPLGADVNTAVYRVVAGDATPYFLKLRRGAVDEASIAVPRFLSDRGIKPVIPPIRTAAGQLWTRVDGFTAVLYPFVAGRDGYGADLTERQWLDLGSTLKALHTTALSAPLMEQIARESYAPRWRDLVRRYQARVEAEAFDDPIAAELAAHMRAQRPLISDLVARAEKLADVLRGRPLKYVLCHGDIHPGNILLAEDGSLYVVDWDTLIYAAKERDLMFAPAAVDGTSRSAREEAVFYQGYGAAEVDAQALAYYHYERIVEDVAAFCEQLLTSEEGGADRAQGLSYYASNFLPGGAIEAAYRADRLGRDG